MKKLIFFITLLNCFLPMSVKAQESKRVNIYYDRNMVCIQRTNKCWAFAKGKSSYPTPTWEGPQYLTTHIKNGFAWQNPLTGQIFNKGNHNLGNIWIQFYEDKKTEWSYGFHQSPYPNVPLSQQESHGCLRMTPHDIKDFSNSLEYFDEFYIIRG